MNVLPLCIVKSDLSSIDKKHFKWRTAKKSKSRIPNPFRSPRGYYEIEYEVRFVVGAIDARFELWVDDKEYAGKNSFKVDWEDKGLRSV